MDWSSNLEVCIEDSEVMSKPSGKEAVIGWLVMFSTEIIGVRTEVCHIFVTPERSSLHF